MYVGHVGRIPETCCKRYYCCQARSSTDGETGRVCGRYRTRYYYIALFAVRQRAACSSMLLTHKHSPKKESQGKRNLCTTSNSLLYNGIYFRLNLIHLLQNTCPNCPFLRITTTLLLYLLLSTVFATRQSISFQSIIARLI